MTSFINPFDLDQTTNRVITLIPARYQSSRLPGKPLIDIAGKSMIQRTYTQASKAKLTTDLIYVVTDNQEIEDHVKSWNGRVLRVDQECLNGTERIAKSISYLELDPKINDSDIVLNVQGDEPFIDPENIDFLLNKHKTLLTSNPKQVDVVTLHSISHGDINNINSCKIVTTRQDRVLYGSRSAIPFNKQGKNGDSSWHEHIGIFSFRPQWLEYLVSTSPTRLQLLEDIEWLQTLELGGKMYSYVAPKKNIPGINTRDDIKKISHLF